MYESGVLVAFLLWFGSTIWMLVLWNSKYHRNWRKVGMRLSMLTLQPAQMTASDRQRTTLGVAFRFVLLGGLGLFSTLLSWLYVAMWAGFFIHRWGKQIGKPAALREFDWKMRNLDLGFDQIAKEMYALHQTLGFQQPEFEQFRSDLWAQAAG